MRRRLLERYAAVRIHQMLGIMPELTCLHVQQGKGALAHAERIDDGVAYALGVTRAGLELVHDQLDEMPLVAVEGIYLV